MCDLRNGKRRADKSKSQIFFAEQSHSGHDNHPARNLEFLCDYLNFSCLSVMDGKPILKNRRSVAEMDCNMTEFQELFSGNRISNQRVLLPDNTRMRIFKEWFFRMSRQRMNGRTNECLLCQGSARYSHPGEPAQILCLEPASRLPALPESVKQLRRNLRPPYKIFYWK